MTMECFGVGDAGVPSLPFFFSRARGGCDEVMRGDCDARKISTATGDESSRNEHVTFLTYFLTKPPVLGHGAGGSSFLVFCYIFAK